jgi:hypothetical protein
MEAHPVLGGFEDEHWHRTASGQLVAQGSAVNGVGSVNRIFARYYHEVTAVAAPGRTVSMLICGRWIRDNAHRGIWGHLDLHTGRTNAAATSASPTPRGSSTTPTTLNPRTGWRRGRGPESAEHAAGTEFEPVAEHEPRGPPPPRGTLLGRRRTGPMFLSTRRAPEDGTRAPGSSTRAAAGAG